jgi:hypothetical protein
MERWFTDRSLQVVLIILLFWIGVVVSSIQSELRNTRISIEELRDRLTARNPELDDDLDEPETQ